MQQEKKLRKNEMKATTHASLEIVIRDLVLKGKMIGQAKRRMSRNASDPKNIGFCRHQGNGKRYIRINSA